MSQTVEQGVEPEVPPSARLLSMLFGLMTSQAISVAAKLGLADLLTDGAKTAGELAAATGAHERSLYRLLRALASVGIFAETDGGRFQLTPLAGPLRRDAPDTMCAFAIYLGEDWHQRVWGGLSYSVSTGQPAFENISGAEFFPWLAGNPGPAQVFNDAMTSLSQSTSREVAAAYDFSAIKKLVDVGGGHGLLLSAIMKKTPRLRGILYDAPSVIDGAQSVLAAHGVGERCSAVGGDFFESVPAGGDAYIMKHIIHDWDDERALTILRHCHRAMTKDGKLLVIEMVLPEGNAPSPGKFLDLEMLLFLHSFERTEAEYRALYERAGFKLTRIVPTQSPYSVIEGVRI
ncbi:MAG: methyltransferase [Pyrinomonadaceae bacterium]|nr:methyltransferase [Pyrinomonadaceae bacterium]